MPTTGTRAEDALIERFLTVYDGGDWAGNLSVKECPERVMDGAVEIIATQVVTGLRLAIEHTLIEPFVGEKSDFHSHFKALAEFLKADVSLKEPGVALYVIAPVNVLPRGADWRGIIVDIATWLRENKEAFPSSAEFRECPSPRHPAGGVRLQVRRELTGDPEESFVIVERYGEMDMEGSVRRALERKLPKLVSTNVDRRLLMLEREQPWVYPKRVWEVVEALRPTFPTLERVHETWIVDTATFGEKGEYVGFRRYHHGEVAESFTFYKGRLRSIARNGMPIPISLGTLDPW